MTDNTPQPRESLFDAPPLGIGGIFLLGYAADLALNLRWWPAGICAIIAVVWIAWAEGVRVSIHMRARGVSR